MKQNDINELISAYYDDELTQSELNYLLEETRKNPKLLSDSEKHLQCKALLFCQLQCVLLEWLHLLKNISSIDPYYTCT